MTPLAPHITVFLRERLPLQRGASVHTCDTYAYAFKLFFEYAAEKLGIVPSDLHLEHLDAPMVLDFLAFLETERGNSRSTRNARLAAIKSFMRFLEYRVPSILDQSRRILAIPKKKTDVKLVKHLTLEETKAILNAPDPRTRSGIRDRAMLHLCFSAGLRVSELVSLPLGAVTLHSDPSVKILGKGRRERILPLWKETARDIRAWIAVRGNPPAQELFLNAQGQPMTRSGFEYILRKHAKVAAGKCPSLSEKNVFPHVLRHTCAMTVLQATLDIRKVSLWLGHADPQTTGIYLRADPTEKLETIEAIVPPRLRQGRFRATDKLIASLKAKGLC